MYADRLKKLNLTTLKYRRHRADMIETYKILHGIYNKDCTPNLILSHNTVTRGHDFNLIYRHMHCDLRKYFFTDRIIKVWNSLPQDIVSAYSVNNFKTNWIDAG